MKQIQKEIQKIKSSIKCWQNHLKETKGRLSDLEDRVAASDYERKELIKTTWNHNNN